MKNKVICTIISLIIITDIFSQKNIIINIAPTLSYRSSLIELTNAVPASPNNPPFTNNFYKQFNVVSAGADFSSLFFKNKLTLQLGTYFRYSYWYYDEVAKVAKKGFKADVFVDVLYNFKKNNNNGLGLYVGVGYGKLNMGGRFNYPYIPAVDSSGPYFKVGKVGFDFTTPKLIIGATKGKWNFCVSAIASPDKDFKPNPSFAAEAKISYRIFSFKIPVKTHQ